MHVTVDSLRYGYGAEPVIDGLSMAVESGESVAVLGPSGCGKTTLLRLLSGLERPDAGSITVGDRTVANGSTFVPPEARKVGMVFQDWALFDHLSVARNVTYGLPRAERTDEAVNTALNLVGLGGMANRMPGTLSGGQQQRVALARALAPKPEVLLMDEPFSNLDATMRDDVRSEVRQLLSDLGITVVIVTHDQAEAFVMGDRVGVMRDGQLLQFDSPARLYNAPVDRFVADFVGIASWLRATADGSQARSALGQLPLAAPNHGEVELLIRPEQLRLVDQASLNGSGAAGQVALVEYYGHDAMVDVRLADGTLRVRCEPTVDLRRGESVGLHFCGAGAVAFPAATAS